MRLATAAMLWFFSASASAEAAEPRFLEEVIVTAERVERDVQDTPIAVTALDETFIRDRGLREPNDFAVFVPSLSVSQFDVTIRGIGRNFRSLGGDPGVASYTNGVYSENVIIGGTENGLYDVQRIEVLRGPQGSLWGRNAIGGVVNYVTNPPTGEYLTELLTRFDEHGSREYFAVLNGPVMPDRVNARLVAYSSDRGDDRKSKAAPGQTALGDTGAWEDKNVALSLELLPSDNFELLIRGTYRDLDNTTREPLIVGQGTGDRRQQSDAVCFPEGADCFVEPAVGTFGLGFLNAGANQTLPVSGDGRGRNLDNEAFPDFKPSSALERSSIAVDGRWHFGYGRFTLRYVGGYTDVDFDTDRTQLSAPGGRNRCVAPLCESGPGGQQVREHHNFINEEFHNHSHDLQLISNFDGPVNFVVGFYGYHLDNTSKLDFYDPAHLGTYRIDPTYGLLGDNPFGEPLPLGKHDNGLNGPGEFGSWGGDDDGTYYGFFTNVEVDSYALYSQATIDLAENWRLTLGARWTRDEKSAHERRWAYFEIPSELILGEGSTLTDLNFALTTDPDSFEPNGEPLRLAGAPASFNSGFDAKDEWDEPTWRLNLDWRPRPDGLAYASVSTGYRSGGYNLGLDQQFSYDEETVIAYEIGYKTELFDNRLRLNGALYHYDYEDHHVRSVQRLPASVFGCSGTFCSDDPNEFEVLDAVTNVPESENRGIELEAVVAVTPQLTIGGLYSYMDTEITDDYFVSASGNPFASEGLDQSFDSVINVKGNELNRAPNHKYTIWGSYLWPLGRAGSLDILSTYSYQDAQFQDVLNLDINRSPSFQRWDARINWDSPTRRFRVSAFVNNITDELGITQLSGGDNFTRIAETTAPRVWGVEFRVRFGNWDQGSVLERSTVRPGSQITQ